MADEGSPGGPRVDRSAVRCAGCGLVVPGGTAGCQELFDAESVREYADVRFARRRRLVVDTYSLQHPEQYCVSAISLAAHLTGVCVGLEHPSRAFGLNAIVQRWLSARPVLGKPTLPTNRGPLSIADLRRASDTDDHDRVVERWAAATWDAYAELQELARAWIHEAELASIPRSHDIARR